MFQVPEHIRPVRDKVRRFVDAEIIPHEAELDSGEPGIRPLVEDLMAKAKAEGLWALGHPTAFGGQGLPFLDYAYVNEVIGRTHAAQLILGTETLQTAIMLDRHAAPEWRENVLRPMVAGEFSVSFAATEPDVAGSDPTGMQTSARLDGDEWVINGRKWFISLLAYAKYVVVWCRTEGDDVPVHKRFSQIIVPRDAPGLKVRRDMDILGLGGVLSGHYDIEFDNVRVPAGNILGERGEGFAMAQNRLGPGRIFHCMRWLGMAQRAFDIMVERVNSRMLHGKPLAAKGMVQKQVFDSYAEIQQARLMVLDAAAKIDAGSQARVEISAIKVVCPNMAHRVVDRAIQVHGAMGLSQDTPLQRMYRGIRVGRFVDGPDEVHIERTARRITDLYARGETWDFGIR
ncbi:MAG: acyl-CoA dehydrogenase family protein [Novosphingobium sp.]|nr:acyl-CoA dehydrogenase family protein [Novosphingobium sp.]